MIYERVPENSVKSIVRQWFRLRITGESKIQIPELVNEAVEHFAKDSLFVKQLMYVMLRPMIYDLAQREVSTTRDVTGTDQQQIILGDEIVTHMELERQVRANSRWLKWLERTDNGHVRLPEMTREDFQSALRYRTENIRLETQLCDLWKRCIEVLAPGQRLLDLIPEEDRLGTWVNSLWQEITGNGRDT